MVRGTALVLTVLTGFTGLVYEVAWQKYLAILLGSHSEATAAILGIFLGGLAVGYALFGRITRALVARAERAGRPPRLLLLYGAVEAGIGAFALLFPALFPLVHRLSAQLPAGAPGVSFAVDVALTIALIGPPTVLMGATIPVLTQALARGLADATRFHAFVYAFNTAGAFAGALAAGFVLVPRLGLAGVLWAMALVNLLVGAAFAGLAVAHRPAARAAPDAAPAPPANGVAPYALVAFLVGFAMMTVQTVTIRIGGLAFGASQFTFSMVVAVFVLCIALGSLAVSALRRIPPIVLVASQWTLVLLLYLLYPHLPDATYWAHVLRTQFTQQDAAFYPYYGSAFGLVLLVLGLPVAIAGATLPLLFHQLRREVGELGAVAGRLYSWNTAGSLAGALLGGYALLFWLDLHQVYRLAAGALVFGAGVLAVRALRLPRIPVAALLVAVPLLALVLLPAWEPHRLAAGLFRKRTAVPGADRGPAAVFDPMLERSTLLFYDDDPTASVAVREHPIRRADLSFAVPEGAVARSVTVNGKTDGSIPYDYVTMALAGILPALFADDCGRAFVIGYGTGVTVGELAALDCTREVIVAEISHAVIEAAAFFESGNQGASASPEVRIQRGDAYRSLLRSDGRFDVIASEPSNPWVTGVEMLFSREFLLAARDRLTPGGVYAQWFHTYETDPAVVSLVLRTYASVFDAVGVWYSVGPDLLLLGFNDPERALDLARFERRAQRADFEAALRRFGIESLPELLAHELLPIGVLRAASLEGDVHTLYHPLLSHRAARAFFRGGRARLPATVTPAAAATGARNSLLRRHLTQYGGAVPDRVREAYVRESCETASPTCVTLLAQWSHDDPDSPALRRTRAHPSASRAEAGLLEELVRFYDGRAPEATPITPRAAQRITRLYEQYYFHAAPFDRAALERVWRDCGDAQPGRCAAARSRAEARVGPLGR
ncbi:MAG: fused MFS/spermidine synthase [Deltaproteobacteria bacterium]|nr:MAG: fused MFS/spermidine synthase [Deltaproteobacteria bacterium]